MPEWNSMFREDLIVILQLHRTFLRCDQGLGSHRCRENEMCSQYQPAIGKTLFVALQFPSCSELVRIGDRIPRGNSRPAATNVAGSNRCAESFSADFAQLFGAQHQLRGPASAPRSEGRTAPAVSRSGKAPARCICMFVCQIMRIFLGIKVRNRRNYS